MGDVADAPKSELGDDRPLPCDDSVVMGDVKGFVFQETGFLSAIRLTIRPTGGWVQDEYDPDDTDDAGGFETI